jgi:hypothetical protein
MLSTSTINIVCQSFRTPVGRAEQQSSGPVTGLFHLQARKYFSNQLFEENIGRKHLWPVYAGFTQICQH